MPTPNVENFDRYNLFDGVILPPINRNSGFDVTELRVPTEIIDSEPESSQILGSSKDF